MQLTGELIYSYLLRLAGQDKQRLQVVLFSEGIHDVDVDGGNGYAACADKGKKIFVRFI